MREGKAQRSVVRTARVDRAAVARAGIETLEQRRLLSTTVGFEAAPIGQLDEFEYEESGYKFEEVRSYGSDPNHSFVYGNGQGYESRVLHPVDWGNQIRVSRSDGERFDVDSFDYAAGRWGEAMDFTVVGQFEDGTTQSMTAASATKTLSTLDLNWSNLLRVDIRFGGGANNAYGAVDNFVVSSDDDGITNPLASATGFNRLKPSEISFAGFDGTEATAVAPAPDGGWYVFGYRVEDNGFDGPKGLGGTHDEYLESILEAGILASFVTKLDADGHVAGGFGTNGSIDPTTLGLASGEVALDLEPLPDGGFLATLGTRSRVGSYVETRTVKLGADLKIDTSFGNNGELPEEIVQISIAPDGRFVGKQGPRWSSQLVLLDENGQSQLSEPVFLADLLGGNSVVAGVGMDADGNFYIGYGADGDDFGVSEFGGTSYYAWISRLSPDLQLDTSYGDNGRTGALQGSSIDSWHASKLFVGASGHAFLYTVHDDNEYGYVFTDDAGNVLRSDTFIVSIFGSSDHPAAYRYQVTESDVYDVHFGTDGTATIVGDFSVDQDLVTGDDYEGFRAALGVEQLLPDGSYAVVGGYGHGYAFYTDPPEDGWDVAFAADGTVATAGFLERATLNAARDAITDLEITAAVRAFTPTAADFLSIDFENISGPLGPSWESDRGLTFVNSGSGSDDLVINGPTHGFASQMLSTQSWQRSIEFFRTDGGQFRLESIDLATNRWGDTGDFVLTGYFADGSTRSYYGPDLFSSKKLGSHEIGWDDLERVEIDFAGGMNHANGSIDNVVFAT